MGLLARKASLGEPGMTLMAMTLSPNIVVSTYAYLKWLRHG